MRLFFISIFLFSVVFAANDVHEIAKKIDALGSDDTLSDKVTYKVYDPFKRAKPLLAKKTIKQKVIKPKPIKVQTILNEQAFIDGKWLQKGSTVHGYKITAIKKNIVVLRHNKKEIFVPLYQGKNFLKAKEIIQ